VAARYNSMEKGLIGPRFVYLYCLLLKIVLGAVALALVITVILQILASPFDAGMHIANLFGSLISAGLGAVGGVTIVFIIIERAAERAPELKNINIYKDWNPKDLPPVTKPVDEIRIHESVIAMVFIVIAAVVFNFFYDKLGVYFTLSAGGSPQYIRLFDANALLLYLPLWNMLWALEFIRHGVLVGLGRETLPTRIYSLVIPALSIVVIAQMIGGPCILAINAVPALLHAPVNVVDIINIVYRVVLIFAMVGTIADIIKRIISLVKSLQ
jgi:hypothetical protein